MKLLFVVFVVCSIPIIFPFIFYYLKVGPSNKKCPKCGKEGFEVYEELIGQYTEMERVKDETKDRNGRVISTTTRQVPVTRSRYYKIYRCKNCGYKEREQHER